MGGVTEDRARVGGQEAQKWNRVGEPCGAGRQMSGHRETWQEAVGGQRGSMPRGDKIGGECMQAERVPFITRGSAA